MNVNLNVQVAVNTETNPNITKSTNQASKAASGLKTPRPIKRYAGLAIAIALSRYLLVLLVAL